MANISDIILQQVKGAAGKVEIPSNIKDKVLGGLSDSILGSLTQTAAKQGGIDQITGLLKGKVKAESSPITALAGKLFTQNVSEKLGLDKKTGGALTAVIPLVMGKLSGFIKDQDGDGDIDMNDLLISLKGGSGSGSSLLGAATSVLGGFFKKK